MRPALNLVMQNESARIGGALAHAATYCDEMVVIDQGSTDNSVEIARKFGATVHEVADLGCPEASYSHAESVTESEWVLLLFADEVLDPAVIPLLLDLPPQVYSATVGRANYVDGVDILPDRPDHTLRYFRRGTVDITPRLHQGLRAKPEYAGSVHAYITDDRWILHLKTLAEQRHDLAQYERLGFDTSVLAGPR